MENNSENINNIKQKKDQLSCIAPITKMNNLIFGQLSTAGNADEVAKIMEEINKCNMRGYTLSVGEKNNKKFRVLDCSYTISLIDEKIQKKITPYDRAVFNAVCGIEISGCNQFTPKNVLETMSGKEVESKNNSEAIRSVDNSIIKMANTGISFDWAEHAKMLGLDIKEDSLVYRGPLLPIESITFLSRNKIPIIGYHVLAEPMLLKYALAVKQVTTLEPKYLAVPKINSTNVNMTIIQYLMIKINQLKNMKKNQKTKVNSIIRFDTLLDQCEVYIDGRTKMKRVKDTIYKILDYYVQTGYIESYNKIMEGQSVTKVEIIV